jgi:hypothetical protein
MARNGSGKESELVRRMRKEIPRSEFLAWAQEDRVVQLTRLRDEEERGGPMWTALDSELQTELLAREQASHSAEVARQTEETQARYARITALKKGPTRGRWYRWMLYDWAISGLRKLGWLLAPFKFACRRPGACLLLALLGYVVPLLATTYFTGLGGNLFVMLMIAGGGIFAFGVTSLDHDSSGHVHWPSTIIAWLAIASFGVMAWANINWRCFGPGDPHDILTVRDRAGRLIRVEENDKAGTSLIKPIQWWNGERVYWYNSLPVEYAATQPVAQGKGVLSFTYTVGLRTESLKRGYQPTSADLKQTHDLVAAEVLNAVSSGPPNPEQAQALAERITAISQPGYRVSKARINNLAVRY